MNTSLSSGPGSERSARLRRRGIATGSILVAVLAFAGTAGASSGQPIVPEPSASDDLLGRTSHGRAALERLGADLAEAAELNGLARSELRHILRTDPTAWLDEDARLYYVEPMSDAAHREAGDHSRATAQIEPAAEAFELHSRPDSHRVVYLDFTGHVVTGTAWNGAVGTDPWNVTAYDTDGDPATFSEAEQNVVREVWARVADDYAALDVDVTTEEPAQEEITRDGSQDEDYGTRLLIDPTLDYQGGCGCGGVAYVGVFDNSSNHAYYQPALAFTEGVGTGAKNLAEVASHEVGHNLGLSHDGQTDGTGYYGGHGNWAPIMGVGYSKPITQWSSGEYVDANNLEDDYAVMADHGAAIVADDHGNDEGSATALTLGAPAPGVVAETSDVDVFAVEVAAGTLTVTAEPAPIEPDLDVKLELLDSAGQVVATADPPSSEADGMAASTSQSVSSGTYFVRIDGTAFGDPVDTGYSDYASRGSYTVTATQ